MAFRTSKILSAVLLLSGLLPATAWPQSSFRLLVPDPSTYGITSSGSVWLHRQPTVMRVSVEVFGVGNTLEEALAKLKEHRDAAKVKLDKLQADKHSVSFSAVAIVDTRSREQRAQEEEIAISWAERGQKPPVGPIRVPITVSSVLTAQWSLNADAPEESLLTVYHLQKKVEAADLAGILVVPERSPEQVDQPKELVLPYRGLRDHDQTLPGTPRFVFAAKFSVQDRDKAASEALAKAIRECERLAKVAKVKLGSMESVIKNEAWGSNGYEITATKYLSEEQKQYLAQNDEQPPYLGTMEGDEVVGATPGPLALVVCVSVGFRAEK